MRQILITNDDGYDAVGIHALADTLNKLKNVNVLVVAPNEEKSVCSHSLTYNNGHKFIKVKDGYYKLTNATPSDCIYLALEKFYKEKKPDLIFSGINHGANLAEDITYSGTCAGAMEGSLHGINSIAISQFYKDSFGNIDIKLACNIAKDIANMIFDNGWPQLPKRHFLNINIPDVKIDNFMGIKVIKCGQKLYFTNANKVDGEWFLEKMGIQFNHKINKNTDLEAILEGYATITPIKVDMSSNRCLKILKDWLSYDKR